MITSRTVGRADVVNPHFLIFLFSFLHHHQGGASEGATWNRATCAAGTHTHAQVGPQKPAVLPETGEPGKGLRGAAGILSLQLLRCVSYLTVGRQFDSNFSISFFFVIKFNIGE